MPKRRSETRRGALYRVGFTTDMGARLERIAGSENLYAAALIREIVERHVIDKERDLSSGNSGNIDLQDKLREELVALNLGIERMEQKRRDMELRLKEERIRAELGHDPFGDDDLDTEPDSDEEVG